ncbi:MAG TPA: hypothetical protein PKZ43_01580 [Bacteroidales bacterium]|nr:hypothetical protein [Bacteroidales bacterium]HQI45896.1 hypothetical protein [Bacteroidales bacterium]
MNKNPLLILKDWETRIETVAFTTISKKNIPITIDVSCISKYDEYIFYYNR